jgi:hypothetical protein
LVGEPFGGLADAPFVGCELRTSDNPAALPEIFRLALLADQQDVVPVRAGWAIG